MRIWNRAAAIAVGVLVLASIGIGQSGVMGGTSDLMQQVAERPAQCRGSVALTFDDGPDASLTTQALDTLAAHDVRVTFFVVGSHIDGNEEIIQRMVEEGHSVQAHTWDHPYLTQLDDEEIEEQVQRTSMAIEQAGAPTPLYVRPPFGDYDARVVGIVEQEGFQVVTWTNALDIRDWDGPASSEQIVERVRENLQSGGVVLLHDVQQNTVEAIPEIIDAIHQEGYCIDLYGRDGSWDLDA